MDRTMMFQPSTMMKSSILKGREMRTGGSIIIPIDIRTEATTMSIMRNGIKMMNPISKDFFNSPITKAGMKTQVEISAGGRWRGWLGSAIEHDQDCFIISLVINPE